LTNEGSRRFLTTLIIDFLEHDLEKYESCNLRPL
jgi:hypothetical protein